MLPIFCAKFGGSEVIRLVKDYSYIIFINEDMNVLTDFLVDSITEMKCKTCSI